MPPLDFRESCVLRAGTSTNMRNSIPGAELSSPLMNGERDGSRIW